MNPYLKKYKNKIKERIRISNENEKLGLDPDPWVIEFRAKNNKAKQKWQANLPKIEKPPRVYKPKWKAPKIPRELWKPNLGRWQKGQKLLTEEEYKISYQNGLARNRAYQKNNRDKINKKIKERKQNNPALRLKANLRKRLSTLIRLKHTTKTTQTMVALGCEMSFFMEYLRSKFTLGMNFDNYGLWHVDHIIPCDSFDFNNPIEVAKCFHYTNLQPLWAKDNRAKSNKIILCA